MQTYIFLFTLVFIWCIMLSEQSTCHNSKGKRICNARKCPKNLNCKGNVGKDRCACCTVCLKQENETCGGQNNYLGSCDHHAPFCEKIGNSKIARCISLKTALLNGIPKYTMKITSCKLTKEEEAKQDLFKCFVKNLNKTLGPLFYCRIEPKYILEKDCCLHNGCNPNEEIYEELDTPVKLMFVDTTKS